MGVEAMPGWFGVVEGLDVVVPGLLLVGVLGRGVDAVVGSERVVVGVARPGASLRGVSVRGGVVDWLGWRVGPWFGVVEAFATGPGVAVGAAFGVWLGFGVAAFGSPAGVGVGVGRGWASVAVALWEWNVGLDDDVRDGESEEPPCAPAPTPALGMEPDVADVPVDVEVGDEVSVGVGVPAGVAVGVAGC